MLLLIDAGNTRIKWALVSEGDATRPAQPGQWTSSGMTTHDGIAQLPAAWSGHAVSRVLLSNVAGQTIEKRLAPLLPRAADGQPLRAEVFQSTDAHAGVRNGYRDPHQLGCDRFAALIGARALFPEQPLIVATCGTATTVDALRADGTFIGGMILPGLGLMASSLAKNTAQLPQVEGSITMPSPFADNTRDAIVSGCLAAQAGAIERAIAAHDDARCIMSGGAAGLVAPYLKAPHTVVENLVLVGLQLAAQY